MYRAKQSPFVVFDIGSASVGGALVAAPDESGKAKIIYSTRIAITFQEDINYDRLMIEMLSAMKSVATNIEQDGIRKSGNEIDVGDIRDVFCVFASPWYVSDINVLKVQRDEPFMISPEFISDIIKAKDEKFKESLRQQLDNKEITNSKLIEKNIIQILLDGYNTDSPHGKKANSIEMTVFKSMISGEIEKKVKELLEKVFSASDISLHTFSLASFGAVRDIFSSEKNFLLMDIGGEVTDIAIVRNDTLVKTTSFDIGKNSLIRESAKLLNTIPEEAHSLLRLYLEGKSIGKESAKMEKALLAAKGEWLSSFRKILTDFSDGLSLPKTIFLTVDTDVGKWFIDTIKSDEFSSYTLAGKPFTVVELSSRILGEHCQTPKDDNFGCDPFLALEALFFHKITDASGDI